MNRCTARAWTYQGKDTIQCDLEEEHLGLHRTHGLFPNVFDQIEADEVFKALVKEQQ